jgi:arylsulfatase A-like enzyme
MQELYVKRLRSLQAIDDLVETLVQTLQKNGQLANTYIVYTSDNGFHMGNHRMPQGKNMPYEEDIRVPMVVRGPGVPAGKTVEQFALNIDLAPTFAQIAGLEVPQSYDGRSLLLLLRGQTPTVWRQSFMVQRGEGAEAQSEDGDAGDRAGAFSALRTAVYTFVQWGSGDRELYDLKADPYQLENLAAKADPALIQRLFTRLAELSKCKGAECRRLEDLPVGTP